MLFSSWSAAGLMQARFYSIISSLLAIPQPVLASETVVLWQDRSQTGLGLGLILLVLQLWSWSWSCSYTFGLVSNTVVHDKTMCDMIMLKCSKHLWPVFFRAISAETVPNVTGHHFFDVLCTKLFFDNKHACCNIRVFFCYAFLLLLNWSWSWSWPCSFGLGLNILVLFPSLVYGPHVSDGTN